jgi:3-(3-hydroxy-phenyl)propionate hydroxylase
VSQAEAQLMMPPVVIIGGGPTGMTLANLLGYAGIPVLLAERNASTSDLPRAVSFDDESLRTFQSCGLEDAAYELIVQGTGTKYFGANGKELAYQRGPAQPPLGHPVKNPFSQPEFERMLRAGLDRFPHVATHFSTELTELHVDDDHTARVTLRNADGELREVVAGVVVGCDGGRSFVREQLGIPMMGTSLGDPWLVVDTLEDEHNERYAMHHCDPRRPFVIVPGRDGRCRYEFRLLPGEDPRDFTALEAVSRLLAPFRTISREQLERCTVYTFHALIAERWQEGPVLLAGDAAHMMPPFAGQGLNSGIRDAGNLAWKIALVSKGQADPRLLRTYEPERRPHAEATVALSVRLGTVMMSRRPTFARVRDTLVRAGLHLPAVHRYVTEGRFKPTARYRTGAVLPATDPDPHGLVGSPLAQPLVLLADGTRRRLDDVLGTGFSLLRVDEPPSRPPLRCDRHPWPTLEPTVVNILLGDRAPREHPAGVEITVADIDGTLTQRLGPYRGRVLLVRPDRFVAAVLPADLAGGADAVAGALALPAQSPQPARPVLTSEGASPD